MRIDAEPEHIKQLDFLVHPFYKPVDRSIFFSEPEGRLELWRGRIDRISRNKFHYLAIRLPIERLRSHEAKEFLNYALSRMGGRLIVVEDESGIDTPEGLAKTYRPVVNWMHQNGFDPNKVKIKIYGEYGSACVTTAISHFLPQILPANRNVRKAAAVLLNLSTTAGELIKPEKIAKGEYADDIFKIRKILRTYPKFRSFLDQFR